jgi:hypothetical protein
MQVLTHTPGPSAGFDSEISSISLYLYLVSIMVSNSAGRGHSKLKLNCVTDYCTVLLRRRFS